MRSPAQARVCNQADLCKFAGWRRLSLAARYRCVAFRIREPQAVVERTGGSDELASPINVTRIILLHCFCGNDLRRLERRRTNQAARRPVSAAGAESRPAHRPPAADKYVRSSFKITN